jgi:hypothetical protein
LTWTAAGGQPKASKALATAAVKLFLEGPLKAMAMAAWTAWRFLFTKTPGRPGQPSEEGLLIMVGFSFAGVGAELDLVPTHPVETNKSRRRRRLAEDRGGKPCTNGIGVNGDAKGTKAGLIFV